MAKITPVLWKHKENSEGRSPIYLRISAGGKTKYRSLRVYLKPTHWNARQRRVRKSHKHSGEINALIQARLSKAQTAVLDFQREGAPVTAARVKESLSEPEAKDGSLDFFAFAEQVQERFRRQGKIHSYKRYKTNLKKLRSFTGAPLRFEEITPDLLREYETYLIEDYGNARSTVATGLRVVRAVLYRAIKTGLASQAENPFFHFKIKAGKPDRDKLSLGQVQAIENLNLEEGSLIWRVRSYFLFSLYGAGIRFGDVARMQRKNITAGGRLVYQMSKTGHAVDLKLVPPALRIVRHYLSSREGSSETHLFPILDGYDTSTAQKMVQSIGNQNALVNKYLKKIARRAEIECHLSFHVARHSFASIAQRKGWDVAVISKSLGHSGLKVTENYLAGFDRSDVDDKMSDLFK